MTKIRLSHRVLVHLNGSGLYQRVGTEFTADDLPIADSLVAKVEAASTRKDCSVIVQLTGAELDMVRRYVEGMEIGGRDNAWDPDGLADYNAARSLLRQIGRRVFARC